MPTTDSSSSDRLLTVRQLADSLNVHPDTVRRWIEKGAVAAVRVGPDKRLRVTEIEARRLAQ